jgi:hypothetical protein
MAGLERGRPLLAPPSCTGLRLLDTGAAIVVVPSGAYTLAAVVGNHRMWALALSLPRWVEFSVSGARQRPLPGPSIRHRAEWTGP